MTTVDGAKSVTDRFFPSCVNLLPGDGSSVAPSPATARGLAVLGARDPLKSAENWGLPNHLVFLDQWKFDKPPWGLTYLKCKFHLPSVERAFESWNGEF